MMKDIGNQLPCLKEEMWIAQLVEHPLSERDVVGSNHGAAPYQLKS